MGQVVKEKKKGRPAKADPKQTARDLRRSHRRRSVKYVFDLDDYFDEDEVFADEEDQMRREKKLKHLFKLQSGGKPEPTNRRVQQASCSSDEEPSKKQKIGEEMDEDVDDRNDMTRRRGSSWWSTREVIAGQERATVGKCKRRWEETAEAVGMKTLPREKGGWLCCSSNCICINVV